MAANIGAEGPSFELTYAPALGPPPHRLTSASYGPLFFGVILNVLLFGVFIVQVRNGCNTLDVLSTHGLSRQVHSYFRLYKTCVVVLLVPRSLP
jgi:hypothetical protein